MATGFKDLSLFVSLSFSAVKAHSKQIRPRRLLATQYNTPENTTLSRQRDLKKYLVPKLDDTLSKYLRSVRPFLTDEQYQRTQAVTERFRQPGGMGSKLQMLLEKRAEEKHNWVSFLQDPDLSSISEKLQVLSLAGRRRHHTLELVLACAFPDLLSS